MPDVDGAGASSWTYAALPAGAGLSPLPSSLWDSWDVRQALSHDSPGTVIAIARQAHGLHQRRLGAMAGFSQSAISRLETGGNLAYDLRVLRIFQRLLGIPPHLLGLSDESYPLLPDDAERLFAQVAPGEVTIRGRSADGRIVPVAVDRYTLLAACTSSIFGALSVDSVEAGEGSRYIDPDVVRRLRVARRLLNESDNWLGAPNLLSPVREMYELADGLRRAATGAVRRQLLDVAALYAEFYGWLHQEVGDLRSAVQWTERALQQALAAEDRELVAYVYIRMGQLAEADGDSDRVIGLARAAQRERVPAWLLVQRAHPRGAACRMPSRTGQVTRGGGAVRGQSSEPGHTLPVGAGSAHRQARASLRGDWGARTRRRARPAGPRGEPQHGIGVRHGRAPQARQVGERPGDRRAPRCSRFVGRSHGDLIVFRSRM